MVILIGQRIPKCRKEPCFPFVTPCFSYFPGNIFLSQMKKKLFKSEWAQRLRSLKCIFISWGDKNIFLGKMKNKERQGETWTLLVFWILCPINVILFTWRHYIFKWKYACSSSILFLCSFDKIILYWVWKNALTK